MLSPVTHPSNALPIPVRPVLPGAPPGCHGRPGLAACGPWHPAVTSPAPRRRQWPRTAPPWAVAIPGRRGFTGMYMILGTYVGGSWSFFRQRATTDDSCSPGRLLLGYDLLLLAGRLLCWRPGASLLIWGNPSRFSWILVRILGPWLVNLDPPIRKAPARPHVMPRP